MVTLISHCPNCKKETELGGNYDTVEDEATIRRVLKDGVLCEVCTTPQGIKQLADIPVPNLLAKQYKKELSKPPLAEFLKIIEAVGGILPIKRYNEVALPGPITEGEVPPPWPKLEVEEIDPFDFYIDPTEKEDK